MHSLGRRLALSEPWWMWTDSAVRHAMERAQLRAWLPLARDVLERNKKNGLFPASHSDLCKPLARDLRTIQRLAKGTHGMTGQMAVGLSIVLGIPMSVLFPEPVQWITRAGQLLCMGFVEPNVIEAYVRYRLGGPRFSNPHLDEATVAKIVDTMPQDFRCPAAAEKAILSAADALGVVLQKISRGNLQ